MTEDELSYKIIGIALELHKEVGPGLLDGFSIKRQLQSNFNVKTLKSGIHRIVNNL